MTDREHDDDAPDYYECNRCSIAWDVAANPPPRCPNCDRPWSHVPLFVRSVIGRG